MACPNIINNQANSFFSACPDLRSEVSHSRQKAPSETILELVAGRISNCLIDCNKMNEHTNQAEHELDHDDTQEIMNYA